MLKLAGYIWNSPNTVLGLMLGLLNPARPHRVDGTFEFYLARGIVRSVCKTLGISGITIGDCILYMVAPDKNIRVHERRHVAQFRLLGPFFLPVYFALLAAYGYRDHPLERDARRHEALVCGCLYPSRLLQGNSADSGE